MGDTEYGDSNHSFRPTQSDTPYFTPSCRDFACGDSGSSSREHFSVVQAGFLSTASQVSSPSQQGINQEQQLCGVHHNRALRGRGGSGAGHGLSRKRRRFPGPLAFLQQGGAGSTGWGVCLIVVPYRRALRSVACTLHIRLIEDWSKIVNSMTEIWILNLRSLKAYTKLRSIWL